MKIISSLIIYFGFSVLETWVEAQKNITFNSITPKIINGVQVDEGAIPYAAFIYIDFDDSGASCTGSLISPSVIVTAAHCLFNEKGVATSPSNIYVSVGSIYNILYNSNAYTVSKSIPHPKYNPSTAANDIGLLVLSSKSDIKTFAKIYDLPITTDLKTFVAGWGVTSNSDASSVSDVLMAVPIQITNNAQCKVYNPSYTNNDGYSICTLTVNNQDSCYGDSGGPLALSSVSSLPLLGLTSFGNGPSAAQYIQNDEKPPCGINGGFGYYTHVFYYIDWITSTTSLSKSSILYSSSGTIQSSAAGSPNIIQSTANGSPNIIMSSSAGFPNIIQTSADDFPIDVASDDVDFPDEIQSSTGGLPSAATSRASSVPTVQTTTQSSTKTTSGSGKIKADYILYLLPFFIVPLFL
ncbi:Trypsin-2 [Smittium mucronatum]|uniref:Trypsin-2 n=1 Tax=Smittium mucronatum TaxID=133383 RepID=A0A1R0H8K1_9FUNG|nr:Trypsin-2 [Smittium mucronatum]